MASRAPVTFGEMQRTLAERDRDVAALAAEVASLRLALGAIRIISNPRIDAEVVAICDLALRQAD